MALLKDIWKLSKEAVLPMVQAWKMKEKTAYKIEPESYHHKEEFGDRVDYYNEHNQLHRTDGPAIEYSNGSKYWYLNGQLHRTDGPAIEWSNGTKYWYLNGQRLTEEEFNQQRRHNASLKFAYKTEPEVIQKGDRVELIDDYIYPPASQAYPIPAGSRGEVRIVYGGHFVVRLDEYDNPNQFHIDNGGTPDEYNDGGWIWTADEIRKIDDRPTALASAEAILYSWIDPDGNVFNVGGDFHSAYAYRIVKEKFPDLFQRAQEKLKATLDKGLNIDPLYAQNMLLQMGWVRTADYGITIGVPFNQVRRGLESYLEKIDSNKDVRVEKYFYDASGDISAYQSIFDGKASELLDEIVHNGSINTLSYRVDPELEVGSRVRLRSDRPSTLFLDRSCLDVIIPAGTEGVITRLPLILGIGHSDFYYRVKFDWTYPTPSDIGDGGYEMGWGCTKDEIVHNGSRLDWIGREVKGYRTNYPDRSDPQSWVGWLIYYTDDGGEFPLSWTVVLYAEPCGRLWGVWEDHSEQGAIDFANNVELRNAVTNIIKENPIDITYGARHKVFDKHNVRIDFMECGNSVIHYNREVF